MIRKWVFFNTCRFPNLPLRDDFPFNVPCVCLFSFPFINIAKPKSQKSKSRLHIKTLQICSFDLTD